MKTSLTTEQRVANILERMRKAMPEIKRQIEIYERSIRSGNEVRLSKLTTQSLQPPIN